VRLVRRPSRGRRTARHLARGGCDRHPGRRAAGVHHLTRPGTRHGGEERGAAARRLRADGIAIEVTQLVAAPAVWPCRSGAAARGGGAATPAGTWARPRPAAASAGRRRGRGAAAAHPDRATRLRLRRPGRRHGLRRRGERRAWGSSGERRRGAPRGRFAGCSRRGLTRPGCRAMRPGGGGPRAIGVSVRSGDGGSLPPSSARKGAGPRRVPPTVPVTPPSRKPPSRPKRTCGKRWRRVPRGPRRASRSHR
jgi:hypothetical protein